MPSPITPITPITLHYEYPGTNTLRFYTVANGANSTLFTPNTHVTLEENPLPTAWNLTFNYYQFTAQTNNLVHNPILYIMPQNLFAPNPNWGMQQPTPVEAPEIVAARVARYEAERRKRDRANRVAEARAERLLLSHLTEEQAKEYKEKRRFRVHLPDGSEFIVEKGYSKNVFRVEDGKKVEAYCIHPNRAMPDGDVMLAQKFMLETDRKAFERIANKTPIQEGIIIAA